MKALSDQEDSKTTALHWGSFMNTQLKFVDKSLRKSNVLTHNTSQHSFGPGSDVIKTYWLRSVFFTKPIIKLCRIFFLTVFFFSFITFHDNVQNPIHSSQSVEKSSFSLYLFLTPAHFNSSTAGKVAGLCFKNENTNLRSLRVFFRHVPSSHF